MKNKTALPRDFLNNGKIIIDPLEIANQFHEYFINVGPSLAKIFNGSSANFMNHLRGTYMNSMFLNEITVNEVAKEITKLNPKKGFGVDGLSPKVRLQKKPLLKPRKMAGRDLKAWRV